MTMQKYKITVIIAHHNCPKLANSSNPARPVMQRFGRVHEQNRTYYRCPACDMEIMLQATVRDDQGGVLDGSDKMPN